MSSAFIHAIELEKILYSSNTSLENKIKIKPIKNEKQEERESPNIIIKEDLDDNEEPKEKEPKKYMYLDKDITTDGMGLNHEFGLCSNKNGKIYKIYICPYNFNNECDLPFIEYLFELNNNAEYNFHYFQFVCPESMETSFSLSNIFDRVFGKTDTEKEASKDEEEDVIHELSAGHTYFMNQCLMQILEMVNIQDSEDPDLLARIYKGFVEHDETSIYAFFDFSGLALKETKANRRWAIMDEILVHRAILGYKMNENVTNMSKENSFLIFIKDENGFHVDLPSILYICSLDAKGDYINLYQSDDKSTFSLFNDKINHPYLGNVYIFSLKPLPSSTGNVSRIRRFVGFTPDAEYVLTDIGRATKAEVGESKFLGFNIPEFLQTNKEPVEEEESEEDSEEEEEEEEESEEEFKEVKKKTFTKKEIKDQLQQISNTSIYFQENKIPYWCIKSRLYFIEA